MSMDSDCNSSEEEENHYLTDVDWVDKYIPNDMDDIVGNRKSIDVLYYWLNNFDKNKATYLKNMKSDGGKKKRKRKKAGDESTATDEGTSKKAVRPITQCSSLAIVGNHGIGKTIAAKVILNKLGYNVQKINSSILKNEKDIKKLLNRLTDKVDVISRFSGIDTKKDAILIDEIEYITSTTEINAIYTIQKENDKKWNCPIIFISNNHHNKMLSKIKKEVKQVRFYPPFESDIKKIFYKVAGAEKMRFKMSAVNKIVSNSLSDVGQLMFILQNLKANYGSDVITEDMVDSYGDVSTNKDIHPDLYAATEDELYKYNSISDSLRYYETDKVNIPLMVYQYYGETIDNNFDSEDKKFELVDTISELFSWGDVTENIIYADQNWNMQEIHGMYTCAIPSYLLRKDRSTEIPLKCKLEYAQDPNKSSIKQINKRNITNANECLTNMNIIDYININKIIRRLIENGEIKKCAELFEGYNIKLDHIESLLKIDKINTSKSNKKISFKSKQRKDFEAYLGEFKKKRKVRSNPLNIYRSFQHI